jgi:peptide/nickel transport system substrate-binding protein
MAPALAQDAEVTREETFKVAIHEQLADPTNLNLYAGASRSSTGLHQVVYEYLFYNNLQTGEFTPWLAESYEYNDDYSALTVHLRDGVTWSDGEPFTSADIVFTYDLLRANPGMEWSAEASGAVSSVEAPDPLTAVFNLTNPSPRFHLFREAFPAVQIWGGLTILPQHIWEAEADPLAFKNSNPIGTGPYVLDSAAQNGLVYKLNENYWGTTVLGHTPGPKQVEFVYLGDEQTVALALSSNEIDVTVNAILSAGTFQQVAGQNPAITAWTGDLPYAWADPCPRALMIQNAHPPLDNPDVRWAISSLIDRDAIVQLAYEGITIPAQGVWPSYDAVTPYMDAVADLYAEYPVTYDPDRATELFAEAGVEPGDITLRYLVNSDSVEDVKVSQVLADQLSAAGINVQVEQMTGQAREPLILAGDYDIISSQAFCPGYITENLELFHSKYYVPLGEPAPWYERNSFRYQNPEFDAIVDQMLATPPDDHDTLIPLFEQAMAEWLPDLPVIPLVQAPALVPFNSTYWQGWPTEADPWNMPVSWWANFNLVLNGYPDAEGNWVGGMQPAGGA